MLFHSLSGPEAHGVIDEMDRRAKSEAPAISSAIDRGDTETVGASPAGTPRGSARRGNPSLRTLGSVGARRSFVRSCGAGPTDRQIHRSLGIRGQRGPATVLGCRESWAQGKKGSKGNFRAQLAKGLFLPKWERSPSNRWESRRKVFGGGRDSLRRTLWSCLQPRALQHSAPGCWPHIAGWRLGEGEPSRSAGASKAAAPCLLEYRVLSSLQ